MALRAMRQPDRDVYLWVDALCIDQANNEERSYQVSIMSQIYAEADNVLI